MKIRPIEPDLKETTSIKDSQGFEYPQSPPLNNRKQPQETYCILKREQIGFLELFYGRKVIRSGGRKSPKRESVFNKRKCFFGRQPELSIFFIFFQFGMCCYDFIQVLEEEGWPGNTPQSFLLLDFISESFYSVTMCYGQISAILSSVITYGVTQFMSLRHNLPLYQKKFNFQITYIP